LRTVRRDPSRSEVTQIDLNEVVRDTEHTWQDMARDKWKVVVTAETAPEPLTIRGDLSHLQQAIENLLFNARDSTFEMRNHLREQARTDPKLDPATRRQAVIDAAAWRGMVTLKTWAESNASVLEVADNGIGMTEEVRERCTQTHFTTKRDNALYEGYNAGMGLGLSFVAMVLDHHGASLEIDSTPLRGARFRLRFPRADSETGTSRPDRRT
jgi:signal transduction histidine kinase